MGVSIPLHLVQLLAKSLHYDITAKGDQSMAVAGRVADMVKAAANSALSQADSHSRLAVTSLTNQVDNSLNFLGSEIADAEARVRQDVAEVMGDIITDLAGVSGGVDDQVANELTQAYDGIAESHTTVGGLVESVIYGTAEQFDKSVKLVGDSVINVVGLANGHIKNVVSGIEKAASQTTQDILNYILPAEAAEAVITWGKVLTSPSAFDFLDMGANKLFKRLDDFITIDIKEMKDWIKMINDAFTDQAWEDMQRAKEG